MATAGSTAKRASGRASRSTGRGTAIAAGEPGDRTLRAVFLRRMRAWTRDLARGAPADALADALAQPSARGTMVHLLTAVPPTSEESEAVRLRGRALERALAVREQLRDEAGGFHATAWVADHLKVSRQSVDKRRREGKLLAIETAHGYDFPACQFTADGVVPGLDEVLGVSAGGGFWETLAGLVTPAPALDDRSILRWLGESDTPERRREAVAAMQAYAHG